MFLRIRRQHCWHSSRGDHIPDVLVATNPVSFLVLVSSWVGKTLSISNSILVGETFLSKRWTVGKICWSGKAFADWTFGDRPCWSGKTFANRYSIAESGFLDQHCWRFGF